MSCDNLCFPRNWSCISIKHLYFFSGCFFVLFCFGFCLAVPLIFERDGEALMVVFDVYAAPLHCVKNRVTHFAILLLG